MILDDIELWLKITIFILAILTFILLADIARLALTDWWKSRRLNKSSKSLVVRKT